MTAKSVPDLSSVVLYEIFQTGRTEDDAAITSLASEAREFLLGFRWCRRIKNFYVGEVAPPFFGVFLVHIEPARSGIDEWLWVFVGDLPSAYLVCDDAPTPRDAVAGYVEEMSRWIAAVRSDGAFDDVIPVDAEKTLENADLLERRLKMLQEHFSLEPGQG